MAMQRGIPEVIVELRGMDGHPSIASIHRRDQQFDCLSVLPTPDQSNLMKSIKSGEIEIVKMLLSGADTKPFTNNMGVSYIEQAVQSGSMGMLQVFLNKARGEHVLLEIIDHAILYAIKHNDLSMVKELLHEKKETIKKLENKPLLPPLRAGKSVQDGARVKAKMHISNKDSWRKHDRPAFDDAEFPMYVSPIILACQLERSEILKLLLRQDDCIGYLEIHPVSVKPCPLRQKNNDYLCDVCSGIDAGYNDIIQPLEDSLRILEVYKALASPAYILNCGIEDPILECFKLRKVLMKLSRCEQAFKSEYKEIAARCSSFAKDLVSLCRDHTEVKTCLAFHKGIEDITSKPDTIPLKRIAVALYYEEKEFIGHSQIQQFIQRRWLKGLWKGCRDRTGYAFYFYIFWQIVVMTLFFPFLCLMFSFKIPCVYNFMKDPVNKYINDTISRLLFIGILIAEIQYPQMYLTKLGCVFSILEVIVAAWVLGMLCRSLKLMCRQGMFQCCGSGANKNQIMSCMHQMVMLLCFLVWFICKCSAISKMETDESTCAVVGECPLELRIAQSCYSVAIILSLFGLVHVFQESRFLGPLEISMSKMILDVLKFMILFFVVFFAFVLGLTKLYSPYKDFIAYGNGTEIEKQSDGMIGVQSTLKTLFWTLFQYPDVLAGANLVLNYTAESEAEYQNAKHRYTEFTGFILIATYHVVAVIVLLNMLIAMMANSYNKVEYNADLEWKFARARLRTLYTSEIGSIPPPFNANPIGHIIKLIVRCCKKACCGNRDPNSRKGCCVLKEQQGDTIKDEDYKDLMNRLTKRYWHKRRQMDLESICNCQCKASNRHKDDCKSASNHT